MKKGEELIWSLFEMVRELMPPTAANAERFQRWAEKFHELEHGVETLAASEELDEPAEDVHGAVSRRKKR